MRFAKETVWATTDGKLVKAGDPKAAFLVAAKNHPVHDKRLEQYSKSDVSSFFKDASFDRHGSPELPPPLPQAPASVVTRLATVKETKADSNAAAKVTTTAAATVTEKRAKLEKAAAPKPAKRKKAKAKK